MFANQVDDLQLISLEKLAEGVAQSCCILLLLNDETLTSKWCEHEVQCARSLGIPIICLLDIDRQPARPVIDSLMEQDYGWLFDRQVVSCKCELWLVAFLSESFLLYCRFYSRSRP